MPYDPQRSHRRPRLADDAPAPIDALLGGADEGANGSAEPAPAEIEVVDVVEIVEVVEVADAVEVGSSPPERADEAAAASGSWRDVEAPAPPPSRRRPAAVVAVAVVVVVLLLAWMRRRRPR